MLLFYALLSLQIFSTLEAVSLGSCAKWDAAGVTVFGSGSLGNASNQLNQPQGMFLHQQTNALYVVDTGNDRIQVFRLNQPSMPGETAVANLASMYAVYVDDDGVTMYIARRFENRVEKWLRSASSGEQVGDQCKQCRDVRLDREKNVYMVESGAHTVMKWSPQTSTTSRAAGRVDEQGATTDRLYFPAGIHLHSGNDALYIADTMNSRIQKWNLNSVEGVTVAGSKDGVSGSDASTLANPVYVWVDESSDIVYIVDTENDRIQRWLPNQMTGTTIAGGTGMGDANNQLKRPTALAFDDLGNLYVCDSKNHRIQMFALVDNQTCSFSHSSSLFGKTTTASVITLMCFFWTIATDLKRS